MVVLLEHVIGVVVVGNGQDGVLVGPASRESLEGVYSKVEPV